MKAVITRVKAASVTVDGVVISQISQGFLALIGVCHDDTPADLAALVKKILSIKIFPPPPPAKGDWKATVQDIQGSILCVSQFTLLARTQRGSKLDFHYAMNPTDAKAMYDDFLSALRKGYDAAKIKDGRFGAMMDVMSVNDGPVTVLLDTKEPKPISSSSAASSVTPTPSSSTIDLPALDKRAKKAAKKAKGMLYVNGGGAADASEVATAVERVEKLGLEKASGEAAAVLKSGDSAGPSARD